MKDIIYILTIIALGVLLTMSVLKPNFFSWASGNSSSQLDKENERYQHEIDSLTKVIEKNNILVEESKKISQTFNDSIAVLNLKIIETDKKIASIKKDYNEKIKSISNFSSNDIERFITDRYK